MTSNPGETPHLPDAATARIEVASGAPTGQHARTPGVETDVDAEMIAALRPGTALLLIPSGPSAGARYLLDEEQFAVGRAPDADIVLDDVTVSRHHARFEATPEGSFRVVDTRSTNGTYVNDEPVESADLAQGDVVQIGKFRLTFHPATALDA
ncbi:hypothetical protein BJF82_09025 [Kytococcus sp. CUA-901]|nr:hypothetical protein BJF82_09025 [Kytococcus sp. CUA-901]